MTRFVWVVGVNGLLGSALKRELPNRPRWQLIHTPSLPWHHPSMTTRTARTIVRNLLRHSMSDNAQKNDNEWSIVWVAGSGVVGSSAESLTAEYRQFTAILRVIGEEVTAAGAASRGTMFYASSAGGIYAGSHNPPYTEKTTPSPLAPYGHNKLRMEAAVTRFAQKTGVAALIGRIANLYGPGQKLDKMQGLISHLAKAQFSPQPASIFVPLDTVRDYLYVDDCATLILNSIEKLARITAIEKVPTTTTKIFCSGQAVTISSLIGYFRALAKGHPHIMLGSSHLTSLQAIDLRLESVVWPDLDRCPLTPLATGIHATILDIVARIQSP
jgi:UDP-glucose 4-epimerase